MRVLLLGLSLLVAACGVRGTHHPPSPSGKAAQLLFVQAARGVSFTGGQLTLRGVSPTTVFFSDRPKRIAGHVLTRRFLADWGKGVDSFAQDPPNATLSVLGSGSVTDSVLELSNPSLHGEDLVYDARLLSGVPPERGGPASLFIDADTNVVVPGLLARPELRRPFAWDTYVYDPNASAGPPTLVERRGGSLWRSHEPGVLREEPVRGGFRTQPSPARLHLRVRTQV